MAAYTTQSRQTNPQGAFLVWNYKERITSDPTSNPHNLEEIIISTYHLVGMKTSKNKSSPAGTFEVILAPTVNWVARLTPGSWCVLLMSRDVFPEIDGGNIGKADRRLVKMFGRINAVRMAVTVDQETGARKTEFVVTGEDWGTIFNSNLYIDLIARNNELSPESYVGHAARISYGSIMLDALDAQSGMPSSSHNVDALIKLWGAPLENVLPGVNSLTSSANLTTLALTAQAQYKLPPAVVQYFGFSGGDSLLAALNPLNASINFGDLIKKYHGVLKDLDTYGGNNGDSNGFIDPNSVYGIHSFWQLLTDNSNPIINELVTDMRWDGPTPSLALYKRVRPFLVRESFPGADEPQVAKNISLFKNIRRILIDKRDVIAINAGTDLAEKINFIEIKPQHAFTKKSHEVNIKFKSQHFDYKAYERDGFRPLIAKCTYLPVDGGDLAPIEATQWKHLLREWHFSKDTMLNGAVTFIGLSDYIQVGDNIMIDASVFGAAFNKNQVDNQTQSSPVAVPLAAPPPQPSYLLAHVEQIEHNFEVNQETGARSFISTVRFVRGVITDINGNLIGEGQGGLLGMSFATFSSFITGATDTNTSALDKKADKLKYEDELLPNVNAVSLKSDPLTNDLKNSDIDGQSSEIGALLGGNSGTLT